jgi:hypothetical protein
MGLKPSCEKRAAEAAPDRLRYRVPQTRPPRQNAKAKAKAKSHPVPGLLRNTRDQPLPAPRPTRPPPSAPPAADVAVNWGNCERCGVLRLPSTGGLNAQGTCTLGCYVDGHRDTVIPEDYTLADYLASEDHSILQNAWYAGYVAGNFNQGGLVIPPTPESPLEYSWEGLGFPGRGQNNTPTAEPEPETDSQ